MKRAEVDELKPTRVPGEAEVTTGRVPGATNADAEEIKRVKMKTRMIFKGADISDMMVCEMGVDKMIFR